MKHGFKLLSLILLSNLTTFGQHLNLGGPGLKVSIGLPVGQAPADGILTLQNRTTIGLNHVSSNGNVQLGTYVDNLNAYIQTHTDHPLQFSTNNGAAQMILSTAGLVGIGTTVPTLAGLVVNKKIGATNAVFGSNTSGVSIESDWPGLGLNTYYNGGRYAIANGYGGLLSLNMANGNISVFTSSTATANQSVNLKESLTVTSSGGVELGENSSNLARGAYSMVFGANNTALGDYTTILGYGNIANGFRSTVIGNFGSTGGYEGSMILADNSMSGITSASTYNQFTARFARGYRLFTNSATTLGVELGSGDNAWSAISDSTKKERFLIINHTDLLANIRALKLGTWNYKGQRDQRHYGPMAQEFFARFGHDALGVIGCDTLINSHDFTAVTLSGVQALALENEQLKTQLAQLKSEHTQTVLRLETRMEALERAVLLRPAPRTTAATKRKQ